MLESILRYIPIFSLPLFPFIIFLDYYRPKHRYKAYAFLGIFYITMGIIIPLLLQLGSYFLPALLFVPCFLFGIALRKPNR